MKKLIVGILFCVSLLTACQMSRNDIMFSGESENWLAKVTVHQTNGEETYEIQINYIGKTIEEIVSFNYQVEFENNGILYNFGADDATFDQEGVYHYKSLSSNSPSTRSEDVLVIKIEWNDTSERFDLRSN